MTPLRIGKAVLLLGLLAPRPLLAADTSSRISVVTSPNPVPEHESVQLQITVDSPLSTPVLQPSFDAPDFTVMGSPGLNYQPENSDEGPNTRKKLTFTYILMPKRAGDFWVRRIQAKAAGQEISTPDVHLKVTPDDGASPRAAPPTPAAPMGGDDEEDAGNPAAPNFRGGGGAMPPAANSRALSVPDRFNSDFTVWAGTNKVKAYVGEPIVVEYYLYDFGGLRQTEVLKWPTFDGFWKEDLEINAQVNFEDVYLRQQEMRRAMLARYALYGIKPGRIQLDKLGIRGKYVSSNPFSAGAFFGFDVRTGQHYSQDVWVDILPLPTEGKPEKFGGGVGRFTLKLEADKVTVPQNTPVTFTLTLAGVGNFQAIDAIKLPLPPDFEMYENTTNGRAVVPIGVRQELESKKTFQVIAIPRKAGKFEIPAIEWSYFNTDKRAYETLHTNALSIEVQPNENGAASGQNSYLPNGGPGGTPPPSNELRYLKGVNLAKKDHFRTYLAWAALAALLANFVLAFRSIHSRSRKLYRYVKNMDPFAEARILLLQAKGIRDAEWQAGLEEAVLQVLQVLLQTNPRGITKQDLEEMWKARGLPAPLFQRVHALLEELDRHRFSSQKLMGAGNNELRSRLTKEVESLLVEASQVKEK